MRICVISREYPPDTGWGGIGTFTHHLAHGLKSLGHDIEVVALAGIQSDAAHSATSAQDCAIPVHRVSPLEIASPTGPFNFCLPVTRPMLEEMSALFIKFLELHRQKPFDVVEAPEHFAEGIFPAASKIVPLVLRLHTPHSKLLSERFHNFSPSFDHQFLSMLERVAMLSAEVLISPSEDLARYVCADLSLPADRIAIVRNPVDSEHFRPEGARALSSDGRLTVLYAGRLEERKGIHYLIDAVPKVLSACPNVRFVVIGSDTLTGSGNGSVLAELRQALTSNGAAEAVTFIAGIPLSGMPDYYRSADIFVLPSLYDNAPIAALEAMSCGKPIVGTTAGGTKEYVIHDQCGLMVEPRNSAALAIALIKLAQDEDLRKRMGDNARQHVLANFTPEAIARDSLKFYELALERFAARQQSALYLKDPGVLVEDMTAFVGSYERMLYELLCLHSWQFRLRHWRNLAGKDPWQFLAKAVALSAKPLLRLWRQPSF